MKQHSALQRMKEAGAVQTKGPHTGSIVKVAGDRRNGLYEVKLGGLYEGRDLMPGETIYNATIQKAIQNTYGYKEGSKVYVVQSAEDDAFGYIDPFVGRKFELGGVAKKMNEKVSLKELFTK